MTEFWAALAGAIVGGLASFSGTWWQTKRVLVHERQLAQDAAKAERQAARHNLDIDTARALFPPLTELEDVVLMLSLPGAGTMGTLGHERGHKSLAVLRDLQNSTVSILSRDEVHESWEQLRELLGELVCARSYSSDARTTLTEGWTVELLERAGADVNAFIHYVRSQLLAAVSDTAMPPRVRDVPVLRRRDMSIWQPPFDVRTV